MMHIIEHEGVWRLFKGIGPQILKGLMVQGLLMMTKERIEIVFILLFRYVRVMREQQLKKLAERVRSSAGKGGPVVMK